MNKQLILNLLWVVTEYVGATPAQLTKLVLVTGYARAKTQPKRCCYGGVIGCPGKKVYKG